MCAAIREKDLVEIKWKPGDKEPDFVKCFGGEISPFLTLVGPTGIIEEQESFPNPEDGLNSIQFYIRRNNPNYSSYDVINPADKNVAVSDNVIPEISKEGDYILKEILFLHKNVKKMQKNIEYLMENQITSSVVPRSGRNDSEDSFEETVENLKLYVDYLRNKADTYALYYHKLKNDTDVYSRVKKEYKRTIENKNGSEIKNFNNKKFDTVDVESVDRFKLSQKDCTVS